VTIPESLINVPNEMGLPTSEPQTWALYDGHLDADCRADPGSGAPACPLCLAWVLPGAPGSGMELRVGPRSSRSRCVATIIGKDGTTRYRQPQADGTVLEWTDTAVGESTRG
jgi:hypothetical protein